MYGAAAGNMEPTVDMPEIMDEATEAPGDKEEEQARGKPEDSEDEMRVPRVGVRPVLPTKAEIKEHYPLHLKYRSWCAHCRAGKARIAPHIREPADRERLGITVSCDYAFMNAEEVDEDVQPSLVIYDDDKDAFWAIGVKSKTVTEPLVKHFKNILDQSGYEGEKITMKSDQEVSVVALKRAVAAARNGETVPIESPVRASQSNGRMEGAIGIWQGQVRTIKHFSEAMFKQRIEINSVLFSWLVPFCAEIMNKFKIGSDGRTSYERITGHKCRHQVIGFAESVDFILETNKNNIHKADSRVMNGIFLGYEWRSTEYIVGTADGIFKCRTVRRKAEEIAYDVNCFDFLKIPYDDYVLKGAKTTSTVTFGARSPAEPDPVPVRGREFIPRRIYTNT